MIEPWFGEMLRHSVSSSCRRLEQIFGFLFLGMCERVGIDVVLEKKTGESYKHGSNLRWFYG